MDAPIHSELPSNGESENGVFRRACRRTAVSLFVVCAVYGAQTIVAVGASSEVTRPAVVAVGNGVNAGLVCWLLGYVGLGVWKGARVMGAFALLGYLVFQACFGLALILHDLDAYHAGVFLRVLHALYLGSLVPASWFTIRAMINRPR